MLKGRNVILKTISQNDIKPIYDIIMNDNIGSTFSTTYKELTLEELPKFLYETENGTLSKVFTIFCKEEVIGIITVSCIHNIRRSAYISYLGIKDGLQNKGLGKDAFTVVVKYCFDYLNLNRLYAHTFEDNDRMSFNGIPKYAGWKLEGTEREYVFRNGKYVNKQIWGLLKREWKDNPVYEHENYKEI